MRYFFLQDPRGGFLPGAGKLFHLTPPSIAENIRVETGVRQNDEVSVHYDPMIAKLVVWGKDRNEALNIMRSKLSEYDVSIKKYRNRNRIMIFIMILIHFRL